MVFAPLSCICDRGLSENKTTTATDLKWLSQLELFTRWTCRFLGHFDRIDLARIDMIGDKKGTWLKDHSVKGLQPGSDQCGYIDAPCFTGGSKEHTFSDMYISYTNIWLTYIVQCGECGEFRSPIMSKQWKQSHSF